MTGSNVDPERDETGFDHAMDWASKLVLRPLNAAEQAEFSIWLARGENRAALVQEALDAFGAPSTLLAAAMSASSRSPAQAMHGKSQPDNRRWRLAGLAAAAVIFMCAGVLIYINPIAPPPQELVFAADQADRGILLEDGSDLMLARGSSLEVVMDAKQRRARLQGGEAMFDISLDPDRPFIVETEWGEVQVLGTEFNVSTWSEGLTVTVLEGVVTWQASSSGEPIRMEAGQGLSMIAGAAPTRFELELDEYADWRTGWVSAQRMPLGEVLAKLERYSEDTIVLSSDISTASPVTGRFRLSQTRSTLATLAALYDLEIEHQPGKIVLSAEGDGRD